MKMRTERHFTFSQPDIIKLIVDHINTNHGMNVTAEDVKINITDSSTYDGMGGSSFTPGSVAARVVAILEDKAL